MSPQQHSLEHVRSVLAGKYTIEREIGVGDLTTVYLGRDGDGREVAVKVLKRHAGWASSPQLFVRETGLTKLLQHPGIIPVLDVGQAEDVLFYVTAYAPGETLRDRLGREGKLPLPDALTITRDLAAALDYAHAKDFLCRSLVPKKVRLANSRASIADFGMLLSIAEGAHGPVTEWQITLTRHMSPEQLSGDRIGRTADVYSLGTLVYQMLAGEPAITGSTLREVLPSVLQATPTPLSAKRPDLPKNVSDAVERALAKVPGARFKTAGEFVAAMGLAGS